MPSATQRNTPQCLNKMKELKDLLKIQDQIMFHQYIPYGCQVANYQSYKHQISTHTRSILGCFCAHYFSNKVQFCLNFHQKYFSNSLTQYLNNFEKFEVFLI